jgi:hypothetical protein
MKITDAITEIVFTIGQRSDGMDWAETTHGGALVRAETRHGATRECARALNLPEGFDCPFRAVGAGDGETRYSGGSVSKHGQGTIIETDRRLSLEFWKPFPKRLAA